MGGYSHDKKNEYKIVGICSRNAHLWYHMPSRSEKKKITFQRIHGVNIQCLLHLLFLTCLRGHYHMREKTQTLLLISFWIAFFLENLNVSSSTYWWSILRKQISVAVWLRNASLIIKFEIKFNKQAAWELFCIKGKKNTKIQKPSIFSRYFSRSHKYCKSRNLHRRLRSTFFWK